ncbi:MAG: rod shape-determining protein MreC [Anaerolineae bacterium]|nr:rod shape-determining protein MreC [Anaerolineae bacterium]
MIRQRIPWLPLILVGVSLLFLVLSETGALSPLERSLSYIVGPIERTLASISDTLGNLTQTSRDIRDLQQQIEELEHANNTLVQENIRLLEYEAENAQLRQQLNFARENPTHSLLGADVIERGCEIYPCASVIGNDTNPYLHYLIINAGSRDEVAVGMPVVTGGSVMVGRIAQVSPNLAYVQLLNDPQIQVAAMLQQSRVTGMVEGTADGGLLMTDILPDEQVNEGETIITSAAGGLLPRGLILGQVATVSYQESELFQQAVVRPAIDFRRLETVLIITNFPTPNLDEFLENEEE